MEQGTASETEGEGMRISQSFQTSDPMIARATMSPDGTVLEAELAVLRRRLAIIGDQLGIPLSAPSSSYDDQVLKAIRRQSDMWASKLLELEGVTDELVILRQKIADLKNYVDKRKGWRGLLRSIFDMTYNRSPAFVRDRLIGLGRD